MPPLTTHTAVVRRLVVSPGAAPAAPAAPAEDPAPGPPLMATAAAVSAVLRAFGRPPESLPARTVVHIGAGAAAVPASAADRPGPEHEGFPVRASASPGRALRRARDELRSGETDFALVAGFGEPGPGAITVYALRRAAEAVADGDPVLGVLDPAGPGDDPDEPPVLRPLKHGGPLADPDAPRLLLWSGRDEADEAAVRAMLRPLLDGLPPEAFPALPAAVPCERAPGPVRASAVTTAGGAPAAVDGAKAVTAHHPRPVALLFPGQGSQHLGMATGLYGREPVFTAAVDAVLALFGEDGPAVRADWLAGATGAAPAVDIDDVRRAQPLLFAVDYALGRMVIGWGVRPAALLGHSAGELVAAVLAGVVSLPDAVTMMRERVRHAVSIPPGGMLAVAASEDTLRPYLRGDVAVAAVNARAQTMLAGPDEPLAEVAAALRADGHTVVAVPATSPFHCPAMAPASDAVEEAYRSIRFREPQLPLYSGYTGELMTPEEARSPRFWARQLTDTVWFRPALDQLLAVDDMLLVEAGPRQTLTAFARRHRAVRLGASAALPLLPARPGPPGADRSAVLAAAARIWQEGHALDPEALSRLWTWQAAPDTADPLGLDRPDASDIADARDANGTLDTRPGARPQPAPAAGVSVHTVPAPGT
ncbi:acyltransferase domain-containing protein [Streptomyces xinghaiensis]|uniref:acyltransferase domain-containing protein n=1 Tax=Streptomyces xinghaiensis TaxID=1038928 RepID=UPI0037BC50EE